jgi:hypothetical protein
MSKIPRKWSKRGNSVDSKTPRGYRCNTLGSESGSAEENPPSWIMSNLIRRDNTAEARVNTEWRKVGQPAARQSRKARWIGWWELRLKGGHNWQITAELERGNVAINLQCIQTRGKCTPAAARKAPRCTESRQRLDEYQRHPTLERRTLGQGARTSHTT